MWNELYTLIYIVSHFSWKHCINAMYCHCNVPLSHSSLDYWPLSSIALCAMSSTGNGKIKVMHWFTSADLVIVRGEMLETRYIVCFMYFVEMHKHIRPVIIGRWQGHFKVMRLCWLSAAQMTLRKELLETGNFV